MLCYSLQLVLARGERPKLGESGVGKLDAPKRGWFNLSSCGSILFLENPLLCRANFILKLKG